MAVDTMVKTTFIASSKLSPLQTGASQKSSLTDNYVHTLSLTVGLVGGAINATAPQSHDVARIAAKPPIQGDVSIFAEM